MKTIEELKLKTPVFLDNFETKEDVYGNFNTKAEVNILFAQYSYGNYDGTAWVLFEKDGELFEVNGGHCSCYGLEDQWEPESVVLKELYNRLENGSFGEGEFKTQLKEFLEI